VALKRHGKEGLPDAQRAPASGVWSVQLAVIHNGAGYQQWRAALIVLLLV